MSIHREVSHGTLKYLHSIVDSGPRIGSFRYVVHTRNVLDMDDTVVRSQKMECSDGTLSWITSSSLSLSLQVVSFKLPIEISHNI